MVDLVLEDPGVEFLRLGLDPVSLEVERRDPDFLGPEDVPPDAGEREAALLSPLAARLRVISGFTRTDTAFSATGLREQEPDAPAHLRGREADPLFEGHERHHLLRLPPDFVVDVHDRRGAREQDGIRIVEDLQAGLPGARSLSRRTWVICFRLTLRMASCAGWQAGRNVIKPGSRP